ncbi:MAG TPA: hypothetical protein VHA73_01420 [Acidimicrobiales bacterium]|nr:hypothetical protein [Acidimicrobiales bacterium]
MDRYSEVVALGATSFPLHRLIWRAPSARLGAAWQPSTRHLIEELVMIVSCWSAKGGAGTTVVAVGLARLLSERAHGALLVDLAGDVPAALGLADPPGPGLGGWLRAGAAVPPDALGRLEVAAGSGLHVVPRGTDDLGDCTRAGVLASLLASDARPVVVDCGVVSESDSVAGVLAGAATRSVLVTRACYLALRRAGRVGLRPSEVALVTEPGRSLSAADVEQVLDAPVRAEVPLDPVVARAVDAGLLGTRLPRSLVRALGGVADAACVP